MIEFDIDEPILEVDNLSASSGRNCVNVFKTGESSRTLNPNQKKVVVVNKLKLDKIKENDERFELYEKASFQEPLSSFNQYTRPNTNVNNRPKTIKSNKRGTSASTIAISDVNQTKGVRAITPHTSNMYQKNFIQTQSHIDSKLTNQSNISTQNIANLKKGRRVSFDGYSIKKHEMKNLMKEQNKIHQIKYFQKLNINFPNLRGLSLTGNGSQYKVVSKGVNTIYFSKNIKDEYTLKKGLQLRDENPGALKKALRWKTLKYLYENHPININKIIKNYDKMKIFLEKTNGTITHKDFKCLLISFRIYDELFIDNIFRMFDENRNNEINIKEVILGLTIFRPANFYTKMNVLIELCDDNNTGFINPEEFLKILKLYISLRNDLKNLNSIFKKFLKKKEETGKIELADKIEFMDFLMHNKEFKEVIKRNIENVSDIDQANEDEITSACFANLKGAKIAAFSDKVDCNPDFEKMDRILKIVNETFKDRNNVEKMGYMSNINAAGEV